jgi:hypothetical protein
VAYGTVSRLRGTRSRPVRAHNRRTLVLDVTGHRL